MTGSHGAPRLRGAFWSLRRWQLKQLLILSCAAGVLSLASIIETSASSEAPQVSAFMGCQHATIGLDRHASARGAGAATLANAQQRLHLRTATTARATAKELDVDAVLKYAGAVAIQMSTIAAFFLALDTAASAAGFQPPDWAVFVLFFGLSIRSRIFSPLDNSRPDLGKAIEGKATGGFNDRVMPGWTPPGIFFPIMWILIVAPLRAASSVLIWQQVGHLCDVSLLALMLHLSIGDTWNTVNNVERRLGAAVLGILCVWLSALFAAYTYYQMLPLAGQILLPTCVWITAAAALVTDTWRLNSAGDEPLFPYKGEVRTQFWFMTK